VGQRPTGSYIPRFRNVWKQETDFLRGYAAGFSGSRMTDRDTSGFGEDLKANLTQKKFGNWRVGSHMMGETIPKESNFVTLGCQLNGPLRHSAAARVRGLRRQRPEDDQRFPRADDGDADPGRLHQHPDQRESRTRPPGLDIHEMGGVRMGKDPKTSLLNKWNQLHHCPNVFVTDGACMTSNSTQNPSLTYMAITARAADQAVKELKKGNL
jgi:choline dehydrogenase-like flavoprotein